MPRTPADAAQRQYECEGLLRDQVEGTGGGSVGSTFPWRRKSSKAAACSKDSCNVAKNLQLRRALAVPFAPGAVETRRP